MKTNLLTSLLIAVTVALCGLCTFQWLRESETRKDVRSLLDKQQSLSHELEEQAGTIQLRDSRIDQLTTELATVQSTVRTQQAELTVLRQQRVDLESAKESLTAQLTAFTETFRDATNRLAGAYEDIRKQNAVIAEVVAQRDQYVAKLNDSIRARNELAEQYNSLVEKVKVWQDKVQARQP